MVEAARFWLTACDWVLPGWPNQDRIRSKGDASSYCMQRHARIEERTHTKYCIGKHSLALLAVCVQAGAHAILVENPHPK